MRPVWQMRLRWRLRPRLSVAFAASAAPDDAASAATASALAVAAAAELLQLYENSINFHQIIEINFQLQLGEAPAIYMQI